MDVVAAFQARRNGDGWVAHCPAHEDSTASLSISRGAGDRWLLHCHAGCATESVVTAAGITMADLQPDRAVERRIVAEYSYVDANGTELYQVVRFEPKDFRQRRRDPVTEQWEWNLRGVDRVLYRLDRLQGKPSVFVTEGEKDVHALEALGLPATTNAGGSGKWSDRYAMQLVAAGVSKIGILPDNDDAGRSHAEAVSTSCSRAGIETRVIALPGLPPKGDVSDWLAQNSKDDLLALARGTTLHAATDPIAGRRLKLTAASAITLRPVRWVWDLTGRDGRIPAGGLTLLAGREGLGKSILADQNAADLTRGRLPGCYFGTPHNVIVVATEDSLSHTLVPRLMAAGADLTRVFFAEMETPDGTPDELVLPRDIAALEQQIRDKNAKMVVLDPLISRLSATLDSHRDADTRRGLEPLVGLAGRTDIAIVGLIHLSKGTTTDILTQVMGSRAFVAVARSVLYTMTDPDNEAVRLCGQGKNNLGRMDLPVLAFTIKGEIVATTTEGDVWAGKLEWLGEVERSIREAAADAQTAHGADRSAIDEAAAWLEDYLQNGPQKSADAKQGAARAGHSTATLKRAFNKLRVQSVNQGFPRTTFWFLSPSRTPTPPVEPVSSRARRHEPTEPTGRNEPTVSRLQSTNSREETPVGLVSSYLDVSPRAEDDDVR